MQVQRSLHVDKGEPDEQGLYDYYYEFEFFEFTDGTEKLVARSYTDTPSEAHFLGKEVDGNSQALTLNDLHMQLLKDAVLYLAELGKLDLRWLSGKGSNGYEPINT